MPRTELCFGAGHLCVLKYDGDGLGLSEAASRLREKNGEVARMTESQVSQAMGQIAALEDPKARAINEKHGDDHGVNLGKLRAVAKAPKIQQPLALELWVAGDTAARLVSLLICKPAEFSADELDSMLRDARVPKVQDWLINYVVRKNPHVEELRVRWFSDADPVAASASWALTSERVVKNPEGIDLAGLLELIDAQMKDAPERLQWTMNNCLGQIGIEYPLYRERVLEIGERLEVLKDYPTPPGCTSPYVPLWVNEMVRRQEA